MTPDGRYDLTAIHPDREVALEVLVDSLEGLLVEAHGGLLRALDYRAATPEGLAIKADVRDALRRTGFRGEFSYRSEI